MAIALTGKRILTKQPQAIQPVDWSHPLLKNADLIIYGKNVLINPTRKELTATGTLSQTASPAGIGTVFTDTDYVSMPVVPTTGGATNWTIAGIFVPVTLPSTYVNAMSSIAGHCEAPNSDAYDRHVAYSSTSNRWLGYLYDGVIKTAISTKAPVVGVPETVIVTTNGASLICAVTGAAEAATAVSSNGFNSYSSAEFVIGNPSHNAPNPKTSIPLLVRTNSYWTLEQRKSFLANPWQIFQQKKSNIISYAAETGLTVNVPLATITATSYAPTVTATNNQTVSVPLATLSSTAYVPVVTASDNKTISVPLATLSVTKYAPVIATTDHKIVSVPIGTLTLTGYIPNVSVSNGQDVNVPFATLTLTSLAPAVLVTDHKTISVPLATATLTAFAPTVATDNSLTVYPNTATLSLTAFTPTVTASNHIVVSVPLSTLSLTAYAPTVGSGDFKLVNVPLATLTLNAYSPTVTATNNVSIAVPFSGLTLAAYAPTISVTSYAVVNVPVASLTLSAKVPTVLTGGHEMYPLAGLTNEYPLNGLTQTYPLAGVQ